MQDVDLKDVLDAVGPTASLVFASWIFLSLLQQRYSSAYDLYRELVDSYRKGLDEPRKAIIGAQILLYKRRIRYMRYSTTLGVIAAILLIVALIMGAAEAMGGGAIFSYTGAACIIFGLMLVIAAALLLGLENLLLVKAVDGELADLEDLRGR